MCIRDRGELVHIALLAAGLLPTLLAALLPGLLLSLLLPTLLLPTLLAALLLALLLLSVCLLPVSYTHLDVYKRQSLNSARLASALRKQDGELHLQSKFDLFSATYQKQRDLGVGPVHRLRGKPLRP